MNRLPLGGFDEFWLVLVVDEELLNEKLLNDESNDVFRCVFKGVFSGVLDDELLNDASNDGVKDELAFNGLLELLLPLIKLPL